MRNQAVWRPDEFASARTNFGAGERKQNRIALSRARLIVRRAPLADGHPGADARPRGPIARGDRAEGYRTAES